MKFYLVILAKSAWMTEKQCGGTLTIHTISGGARNLYLGGPCINFFFFFCVCMKCKIVPLPPLTV